MIGFQSLFRALKAGCLGKDPAVKVKEERGGFLCIMCCNFHSPKRSEVHSNRALRRGDLSGDVREVLSTPSSGLTFLEEFCHQLRISDEEFLGSLSNRGTDARWAWTVCQTCFPFVERTVNRRRRCLVMEDRVNRLQLQVLKELRRLKEGMDLFYMDLVEIQGLVNGADTHNQAYREEMDDKQVDGLHSFRQRILEVINELQSYQSDVDARLLYPKMTIHEAEGRLPVKQEILSDTEIELDQESDVDWTLDGLYEDNNCRVDVESSGNESEQDVPTSTKTKMSSVFKSRRRRSYFTKRANPEEDSDVEWKLNETKDNCDVGDDDGSGSNCDYLPSSAKKPEKPKATTMKKILTKRLEAKSKIQPKTKVKLKKKRGNGEGNVESKNDPDSTPKFPISTVCLETSLLPARKKRDEKRKGAPKSDMNRKLCELEKDSDLEVNSSKKDASEDDNVKSKCDYDNASPSLTEKSPQTSPSSSRKRNRKIKYDQESDMEWNLSGLDDVDNFEDDNDSDSDYSFSPSKSKTSVKPSVIEGNDEEDPKTKTDFKVHDSPDKDPSETPRKRRRRRKKTVILNRSKPNMPPGLNKEEILRADHDLDLAELSYIRKYFIIRSERCRKEPPPPPSVQEGSEEELLRKRSKYSLEYDSTVGKATLNGIEVILNDEANLIQCSRCTHQVTWSEIRSKLKKNRSEHVVAARMEQNIAEHILGIHLDAFNCPFCDLKITFWHKYFSHVKYVHLSFRDCEVCGRPGMNRQTLKMHMWTHLSEEEKKGLDPPERYRTDKLDYNDPVTCDECGKRLKNLQVLRQHKKTHLPDGDRVICPVCGKGMRQYHYDNYHKKYTCPIVDTESPTGWESFHQRGIKCIHCPVILKNVLSLRNHIARLHSAQALADEKSYLCPSCGKGFAFNANLQRHLKLHGNEKTSKCGWGCGDEFTAKRKRVQHEAVCPAKPETATPTDTVRGENEPHPCLHCSETLKNRQLFRQHMKRFHTSEADARPHECHVCKKRFRMRGDLTDHMQTHREDRPWKCGWGCGKDFHVKGNWREHEARCKSKQSIDEKVEQQISGISR